MEEGSRTRRKLYLLRIIEVCRAVRCGAVRCLRVFACASLARSLGRPPRHSALRMRKFFFPEASLLRVPFIVASFCPTS